MSKTVINIKGTKPTTQAPKPKPESKPIKLLGGVDSKSYKK